MTGYDRGVGRGSGIAVGDIFLGKVPGSFDGDAGGFRICLPGDWAWIRRDGGPGPLG